MTFEELSQRQQQPNELAYLLLQVASYLHFGYVVAL